ncbi:MAG: AAA family ATPase, partial [Tissierellia bacterium]|nr:AAA family ATPase [Tissierellia bacterium]
MDEYLVPIEQLKKKCDPSLFKGDTTEELPASRELIGQGRAMEALKYGLSIQRKGYNIYVSGLTGTGRNSYSYLVAKDFAEKREAPKDWCYVFNFKRPKYPKAIGMKPGQGMIFKNEVKQAIRNIGLEIPKILTSKEYENNRNLLYTNHQKNAQKIINELNDLAKQYNFIFRLTEKGMMSIPLKEGKPMTDEELNNLPESEIEELVKISNELNQKAYDYIKRIKEVEDTYLRELKSLKEENVLKVLDDHLNILIEKYKYNQDICEYLEDMKVDIVKHYEMFMKDDEKK